MWQPMTSKSDEVCPISFFLVFPRQLSPIEPGFEVVILLQCLQEISSCGYPTRCIGSYPLPLRYLPLYIPIFRIHPCD